MEKQNPHPPEFLAWPKIPRFNRDVTITEKLDGTNACIIVTESGEVWAQSRKRIITPDSDNFGFARWVSENAEVLSTGLGIGYHFGEWYGLGIQRGYSLDHKRFALFNAEKYEWAKEACADIALEAVPILWRGTGADLNEGILTSLGILRLFGSRVVQDFKPAEGIVIYHHAANMSFKVLLEGDDRPKGKGDGNN